MSIDKNLPNEITVKIEKLSNLGLGIARHYGFVIFVKDACPEDIVKIKITKRNKNFANAEIIETIEPSQYRVKPFCAMQKICGACQIQYIDYDYQLVAKKEIVKDIFRSIYGKDILVKDVIASPSIKEFRHKIQYPISETKNSKRILAGYYKTDSHELVNIKHCPIQPSCCDTIIDFIRENAQVCNISGYYEKKHIGELRHVVIRSSYYNKQNLVVLVINSDNISNGIKTLANKIYTELDNIAGVMVNFNTNKTNLILGKKTTLLVGQNYIEEALCDKIFKIGAETFFQVNPQSADNIFRYVKNYIKENFNNPTILDAYAGITVFGISLSDIASNITSVEENFASVNLATEIITQNKIYNINNYNMDAEKFFEAELEQEKQYDIVVLDPPRKGCSKESLDYALNLTKKNDNAKIIYVSCNPATLARDLKYVTEKGRKVDFIQPFDMFPHTYHIENVAIINK